MRKSLFFLATLLLISNLLLSQTRSISGKIMDSKDKSPLAGVTIMTKGAKATAISGPDGSFSIKIAPKATALHFTYIGYDDQEVPIATGGDPLIISLAQTQKALNEVVVVGYGKASKKDYTGSLSRLDTKAVENYPAPSFESAIQGKAPGVVVTSGSGRVGEAIQINIRGISSIGASTQPLYVLDGLPIQTNSLSNTGNNATNPLVDINPNDIESLDILKDAAATAIYGARGANGVILITTKKGKNARKTAFALDVSTGISNPARKWHFMNAKQYLQLVHDAAAGDAQEDIREGLSGYPSVDSATNDYFGHGAANANGFGYSDFYDQLSLGTDWQNAAVNTDWQKASLHHNAANHQINLSTSGGNDKTRFFISGFYNTQDAIVINNTFSRYGARFNIDHNATDKLVFGVNMAVDRSQLNKVTNDNSFSAPGELVAQLPLSPYNDPSTGLPNNNTLYGNGIYDAIYDFDHQTSYRVLGNAYGNLTIIPSLQFRSEIGADILNLTENSFAGKESQDGAPLGNAFTIFAQSVNLNTNNYFTFTPNLGDKSRLNVVAGMEYLQAQVFRSTASAQGFPSDAVKNLSGASTVLTGTSTSNTDDFLSYFLRANYAYDGKYLLGASFRTDGSSRFSPDHRYGSFPALSLGWIISEEDFMKNSSLFSTLKIRASYGQTGNAEIGAFKYLSLYGVTNYPNLPGFAASQLGGPLGWESNTQADAGLEFGILKSRISGEVDYYHKHSTKLLLAVNVPQSTGFPSVTQNLGKLDNMGFEVSLNSQNFVGAFKWSTGITLGYNKNKIGDIGGQIIESNDQLQRAIKGSPLGTWYMQKFAGVDPANGDALYWDATGKTKTNIYADAGRFDVGKYTPDYTIGFNNTFSYAGFDLNVFFYAVTGVKLYNSAGVYMTDGFINGNLDNQTIQESNSWTHPGQITNTPRAGYFLGSGGQNSTQYLYNGDYIRLKNLALGYTLPKSVYSALKVSSARIYVSGTNLLTFTKYPGDPEVSTLPVNNVGGGEDFYTIPQPRTFTVGLSVKF
jgi:TonB-dependent starch-binding outer membrane protein SusC